MLIISHPKFSEITTNSKSAVGKTSKCFRNKSLILTKVEFFLIKNTVKSNIVKFYLFDSL